MLAAESSSALVTPGIDPLPHQDVSNSTSVRNFQRQSPRCVFMAETLRSGLTASMSCVLLLNSCMAFGSKLPKAMGICGPSLQLS